MRIWSIHPRYLDAKGLVALWRETLLAKNVLLGNTKGYKNHPQLNRFKGTDDPVNYINYYLSEVLKEALERGYNFDEGKVGDFVLGNKIVIANGQIDYEFKHLLEKLKIRDEERHEMFKGDKDIEVHPLFEVVDGGVADWEVV